MQLQQMFTVNRKRSTTSHKEVIGESISFAVHKIKRPLVQKCKAANIYHKSITSSKLRFLTKLYVLTW